MVDSQRNVIRQCLRAIQEGPFIEDWEFHTRLGMHRKELEELLSRWPNIDDSRDDSIEVLAINNCFNEICHGVGISDVEWKAWMTVSRSEVRQAYKDWAKARGWKSTGIK